VFDLTQVSQAVDNADGSTTSDDVAMERDALARQRNDSRRPERLPLSFIIVTSLDTTVEHVVSVESASTVETFSVAEDLLAITSN
jgi:hypothetical protein